MKKQLFTLTLLTLGYVASSQGAGVAVMAHLSKFNETMAVGTTQTFRAVAAYIESEKPAVAGQSVVKLEETKPGKWMITTMNPGEVHVIIEKNLAGFHHTTKVHVAEHDLIVTGKVKGNNKRDRDGLRVNSIESVEYDEPMEDEGIMIVEVDDIK